MLKMSAVDGKEDSASAIDEKNMDSNNYESPTADNDSVNLSEKGSGDTKNSAKEGNLTLTELEKEEIVKITEINPVEFNTNASREITDYNLTKISSITAPSTSEVVEIGIDVDTNEIDTKLDLNVPLKISKSDDSIIEKPIHIQLNDKEENVTPSNDCKSKTDDDLNDTFDDDDELTLKWDDDESDQGLSEEALKLLDQELGIDDIMSRSEIDSKTLENTNKNTNIAQSDIENTNTNNDQAKTDVEDPTKTSNKELISVTEEIPIKSLELIDDCIKTDFDKPFAETKSQEVIKDCIITDVDKPTAEISTLDEDKNVSIEKMNVDLTENFDIDEINGVEENIAENVVDMTDSLNAGNTDAAKTGTDNDTSIINSNDKDTEQSDIPIEKLNEEDLSDNIRNSTVENVEDFTERVESTEILEMTEDTNKQETSVLENESTEDNLKNKESIITAEVITDEQKTDIENDKIQIDNITDTPNQGQSQSMKTDLGLNKPDVMLEIPTQELIDIDEFDESFDVDKDMCSVEKEADVTKNDAANQAKIKRQVDNLLEKTSDNDKSLDITELTVTGIVKEKELSEANKDKNNFNIKTGEITEKSSDNIEKSANTDIKAIDTNLNPFDKPSIDDDQPSTSKTVDNVVDILKSDKSVDTNLNPIDKPSIDDDKPSTCKIVDNVVDIPTTDKTIATEVKSADTNVKLPDTEAKSAEANVKSADTDLKRDEQPSSKIDDNMAEEPESDSLLAESSRTVDDDDDHDDEDSDDFDQDDESSNHMTAEHSEESNPPPSESELAKDEECEKETAAPDDNVVESDAQCEDNDEPRLDIVDDIVCEETDIAEEVSVDTTTLNKDLLDIKSPNNDEKTQPGSPSKERDVTPEKDTGIILKNLLTKVRSIDKQSPSKAARLSLSNNATVKILSYVDLEESSDEDLQETNKDKTKPENIEKDDSIDITKDETSAEENAVVKPKTPFKMTKLNTSEVSIKTGVSSKPPLIIPEITNILDKEKVNKQNDTQAAEVFTLDSDSEEEKENTQQEAQPDKTTEVSKFNTKCINPMCTTICSEQHYIADANVVRYYGPTKKRAICGPCLEEVQKRNQTLIDGIRNLTPLLELHMEKPTNQLVEISDSESEDESEILKECKDVIGVNEANILSDKLVDLINDAWQKFNMDDRLKDSEDYINNELQKLEDEGAEVNKLLDECQSETDRIRKELYNTFRISTKQLPALSIHDTPVSSMDRIRKEFYNTFRISTKQLPALSIHDTPVSSYTCLERDVPVVFTPPRSAAEEPPAKKPNLGDNQTVSEGSASATDKKEDTKSDKQDDDRDVSVVLLSAEAAPSELPPAGEVVRPALRPGLPVHAMRNAFGSWLRGRILDILPKGPQQQYTHCRVKFDHNVKNPCKVLPARCIAYQEPCNVRMTIGTRVLALFRDTTRKESFYSGVVAEIPNPVNSYRYLVFFDDGYAQYVKHQDTRLVCESKSLVWEEVHPFIRDFVKDYLLKYPERPMVRLHAGQRLNTEWNGKWWSSKVLQVDASLAHVHFEEDDRTEWIYRGSTRLAPLYLELQAAGRQRTRLPRSKAQFRTNMPYVEYMRSEEQMKAQQQDEMLRRQRAVAKKSTTQPQPAPAEDKPDSVTSRVVYYTPKNAVKPRKMVPHTCGPHCKRNDVLTLKELRTYNPLAKPLLSGWERLLVRYRGTKAIMYRAPCGRRIRDIKELHKYLRLTDSELPVDLFDFNVNTHCLAEFVLHKYNVMKKDLSHGKENVPVPCVNYYDDALPEFCSYNTERTPTAGVPLNIDPEFLCGCDCEDDCEDKSKCACWKMTLEGARTIGLDTSDVGYVYRRLPEPLPSGIYECNSRCKCKSTCLNRVAQQPLQLKLQVFKTLKRGWGIRALNDVPKGSFLCVYAGNLLTDATANLDGLNEGDEYLAELDYIEVVEQMKEGYEEDIPEADKKLDKKESTRKSESEEEAATESEDEQNDSDKMDDDFQPGHIGMGLIDFDKRLRKRNKKKQEKENKEKDKEGDGEKTENCITISDDEEVREPSRFTAQAGMGDKEFISKYRSVRTLFGEDEACYIMDAKVQGNIGRYLNHSCQPNVFVQNVFVDTHDPRFPWVAFFALSHIRAGTELTWNYNYDIGSVPGKVLYCYCGASNCRGRLL